MYCTVSVYIVYMFMYSFMCLCYICTRGLASCCAAALSGATLCGATQCSALLIPLPFANKQHDITHCHSHDHIQVVVQYETEELDLVLHALESTTAHLTAAIVSKDILFQNKVGR